MTAGFGWLGEINNQFNQTKYNFPAVAGWRHSAIHHVGRPAYADKMGHARVLATVHQSQARCRHCEQLALDQGTQYLQYGWRVPSRLPGRQRGADSRRAVRFQPKDYVCSEPQRSEFRHIRQRVCELPAGPSGYRQIAANSQELRLRNLDISPYIQDDIKLTPKLTVNLGLRWDIMVPFTENNNLIVFFNPTSFEPSSGWTTRSRYEIRQLHWLRRIQRGQIFTGVTLDQALGFAYQLNDKTVVQAGFSYRFPEWWRL